MPRTINVSDVKDAIKDAKSIASESRKEVISLMKGLGETGDKDTAKALRGAVGDFIKAQRTIHDGKAKLQKVEDAKRDPAA